MTVKTATKRELPKGTFSYLTLSQMSGSMCLRLNLKD